MGAKITLLVSMLVSVGGVGGTNHVATQMTANTQEKVQMTMTINSGTKDHRKAASRDCDVPTHVERHSKKKTKEKRHLGPTKKNGRLRAAS